MFSHLKGKKLLVLGSTELISVIVRKAKELGVYTIVTDNRSIEKAPAKQIADKYYDISFSEIDKIKQIIQNEHIDGVMTGFTDSYLQYYFKICQETNLPCYGGEKQFLIATDKSAFKTACRESGVPVIPGINITEYSCALEFCNDNGYPVMLKPVDNSGSRGVIKCECEKELKKAFEYAMSFSIIGEVIIERYMDCDNIAVSYFASNGEIVLSTTDDRKMYISKKTGSSISSYSEYPSVYTERYMKEINNKVIKMLKNNGFTEGLISLQAFVDEKSFYFCEMCYRLSGGQHYLLVENQHGIDQLALQIEFAVTGSCKEHWDYKQESPLFNDKYAMLRIIGHPETKIHSIAGFDEVARDNNVIKCYQTKHCGEIIGKDGTTDQVLGNILYKFSQNEHAQNAANRMFKNIKITDENDESIAFISID